MVVWQFINFFIISLWVSLGNDTVGYYLVLVILGNYWSFFIINYPRLPYRYLDQNKAIRSRKDKKAKSKLVINLIHLMVLGILDLFPKSLTLEAEEDKNFGLFLFFIEYIDFSFFLFKLWIFTLLWIVIMTSPPWEAKKPT